jgi:redox-sensitive bicupin YhaK (pirin superfamily)
MITRRNANERGPTNIGWLNSKHTFSFGGYHDPAHMGFGSLRVINDDRVAPGAGFSTHSHNNMEIISYVLEGELAHRDSMGTGSVIRPGDVQLMSAGTGVSHSEFNNSDKQEVHFLQIWILPNQRNPAPRYEQKSFAPQELRNRFRLVVSPDGENGSLPIRQDARLLAGRFDEGAETTVPLQPGRKYWVHVAAGGTVINGEGAAEGDGLAFEQEGELRLKALTAAEVLLFELA